MHAERDQGEAAEAKPRRANFARADAVGEVADRRLGQAGYEAEYRQREAKFDIADAELSFRKGNSIGSRKSGNG